MKQFIFIIILFVTTTVTFAQQDSISTNTEIYSECVTGSNVEKLVDKYSVKIEAAFTALAEKLEQPVEYIWTAFVKVQFAQGILYCLLPLLTIILSITFYKSYMYGDKTTTITKYDRYSSKEYTELTNNWIDGQIALVVVLGILTIIFLMWSIFAAFDGVQRLISPEYFALKEIINLF